MSFHPGVPMGHAVTPDGELVTLFSEPYEVPGYALRGDRYRFTDGRCFWSVPLTEGPGNEEE